MRIRMLSSRPGSPDGVAVRLYAAGTEHDLGATPGELDLARVFVAAGFAEEVAPAALPAAEPAAGDASAAARPGRRPRT